MAENKTHEFKRFEKSIFTVNTINISFNFLILNLSFESNFLVNWDLCLCEGYVACEKYFFSKLATITELESKLKSVANGIQVSLIAYVFEKSFYISSILRKIWWNPLKHFVEGKSVLSSVKTKHSFIKTFELLAKTFGKVVKSEIYAPKVTFWEKTTYLTLLY